MKDFDKPLPPDSNGIVWVRPDKTPEDDVFNRPWMENLNNQLLIRYWKRKGCPGYLYTWHNGVQIWHRYLPSVGMFSFVATPYFDGYARARHGKPDTKQ